MTSLKETALSRNRALRVVRYVTPTNAYAEAWSETPGSSLRFPLGPRWNPGSSHHVGSTGQENRIKRAPVKPLSLAPRTAPRRLKLRHVGRDRLTIARRRADEGYTYHAADGTQITDAVMLKRFASLAVPPAYEEVYFCPDEQAHLQAVGRDAAGRPQYRYHPDWGKVREAGEGRRFAGLAAALPKIRRALGPDLSRPEATIHFA